jgi:hypothetical protein
MSFLRRISSSATWTGLLRGSDDFAMPAVTNVQALALGQAVIVVLIVLGVDLDAGTQQLLLALSAAIGAGLPLSDAVIRQGRSKNAAEVAKAKATVAAATSSTPGEGDAAPEADDLGLDETARAALLTRLMQLS